MTMIDAVVLDGHTAVVDKTATRITLQMGHHTIEPKSGLKTIIHGVPQHALPPVLRAMLQGG